MKYPPRRKVNEPRVLTGFRDGSYTAIESEPQPERSTSSHSARPLGVTRLSEHTPARLLDVVVQLESFTLGTHRDPRDAAVL